MAMKTKRVKKLILYPMIIFVLFVSFVLPPSSQAKASDATKSENSGGFIIETTKVDGAMDLLGALTGNITIWEGQIEGLTITKIIERGGGLEPLVVRIKAPGPIPVRNLNAQTVGNQLPNIGGLCKPGKLGWICMENVVMNVEEQFVENISLVDATIETCYLSQCGALPAYHPMSLEELEKLLGKEKDKDSLLDILDLLEEQEKNLERVKEILDTIVGILDDIENHDYPGKLLDEIATVSEGITKKLGLDQLTAPIKSLKETYDSFTNQVSLLSSIQKEVENLLDKMESGISQLDTRFAEYNSSSAEGQTKNDQLIVYEQLMALAEQQKAGKELDPAQFDKMLEEIREKQEEFQELQKRFDGLKEQFQEQKEHYSSLKADIESIQSDSKNIDTKYNGLLALLKDIGTENEEEGLLDDILDPVNDNVLDPVKDKVIDPIKDNVLDPVLDPVKDNVLNPIGKNILEPVTEEVLYPILDPVNGNLIDPITKKVIEPILDPITNELISPITGEIIEKVVDPVTSEVLDATSDEVLTPLLGKTIDKLLNPLKPKGGG
jgi:Tfp pilus assembly protein PilO